MVNPLPPGPGSPNCFEATISVSAAREEVLNAIERAIREHRGLLAGKTESVSTEAYEIFAVFKIGPFRDDLNVMVEQEEGGSAVLHIRSASRLGYFDYGVNRRRVRALLKKIQALLVAE